MKKLRLLLFADCNRNCPGCCNKDWDLDSLPLCNSYAGYDEILITGGEPLLKPEITRMVILHIRQENPSARIYVYTAKIDNYGCALDILKMADGFTVTLHNDADRLIFEYFTAMLHPSLKRKKELRLNVFKGVGLPWIADGSWQVKTDIEWQKDCPLPEGEVFMKWNPAIT